MDSFYVGPVVRPLLLNLIDSFRFSTNYSGRPFTIRENGECVT